MRKTFPEIENASLKNQGDKERTTVDMWVQKETRCLGWSVNKVWMPAFFSIFFFWMPALFSNRRPEGRP